MKIKVAWIGSGKSKEPAIQTLTDEYLKRISHYISIEAVALRNENALLDLCGRITSRTASKKSNTSPGKSAGGKSTLVLLDSRGKELSSEEFAQFVGNYQDRNPLPLVFAIGPADGFSESIRATSQSTLSLGKITLAHELARVVLLEQVYRAFTILKGHPYHSGH